MVANKRTLEFVDPIALNFLVRLPALLFIAVAVSVLTGFRLWSVGFGMTWTAAGYICISAAVTWLIGFNAYFLALRLGSVGVVSPITSTDPVFTAVFAVLLLSTALNGLIVAGLLLATGGVMLISRWMDLPADPHGEVLSPPPTHHPRRGPQAEVVFLSLATAAGWGLAPVIIQLAERSVGGTSATMILQGQALGVLMLAPQALRRRKRLFTRRLSPAERRLAVRLVVTTGALEATFSVLYYLLIDHLGALLTTIIIGSSPIFAIFGGITMLRERTGAKLIFGAAVTLAGVFLAVAGT